MELPYKLLPEDLDALSLGDVKEKAIATAQLITRSRYDLGRALSHIKKRGSWHIDYRSVIDFAEAELGIGRREAYQLMQVEEKLEKLPKLRAAYASGEISYSNIRTLVSVATAEDEDRCLELGKKLKNRELYALVRKEAHERAEKGEAPWPETGLYGEFGRPEPVGKRFQRPYTPYLYELESRVMELHNRFYGIDCRWGEFFEAACVSYEQELQAAVSTMPSMARETLERDGWRCRFPLCTQRATLEAHHVVLRSQGGKDELDNLVGLCHGCHSARHNELLRVEGCASDGFRFAYRDDHDSEWVECPEVSKEPVPCDPHERAPDLDEMEFFETQEPPRRGAIWVCGPSRPKQHSYDNNAVRRTWHVRAPFVRYSGTLSKRLPGSDHVCTTARADAGAHGTGLNASPFGRDAGLSNETG